MSRAGRIAWQISEKDKVTGYHDDQNKYRDHWGISANDSARDVSHPGDADQLRERDALDADPHQPAAVRCRRSASTTRSTPSCISRTCSTASATRCGTPSAIRASRVYAILDNGTSKRAGRLERAGRPLLAAPHLLGIDVVRDRLARVQGRHGGQRGQLAPARGVHGRRVDDHLHQRQPEHDDAAAADRPPQPHQGRRRHLRAGSLDDGPRDAQPRPALRLVPGRDAAKAKCCRTGYNAGIKFGKCADGNNDLAAGCVGKVQDWKDISPRVGFALDVFGDGRTAIKASLARYVAGQQIAVANANNPVTALGLTDERPWTDSDGNGLPFDGGRQPAVQRAQAVDDDADVRPERLDDAVRRAGRLNGWFKREYNWEYQRRAAAPALRPDVGPAAATSAAASATRRSPTTCATVPGDYDGPFCINAPANSESSGWRQLSGLRPLRPEAVGVRRAARRPNNLVRFAKRLRRRRDEHLLRVRRATSSRGSPTARSRASA